MFTMMFVAGTRILYILPIFAGGLLGMLWIATHIGERNSRIMAFLDLERFKEGAGLQQYQALIAFGSGGVEGLGLGNGRQKMAYLPFAHTAFIFPMVGEELGLRCTLLIVFCYVVIIICGTCIATRARDRFGMLLGFGLVVILGLQAALNIGVTTALLPNKGLPLPLISYGGSNLAFCLFCVGILINIYRQGLDEKVDKTSVRLRVRTTPHRFMSVLDCPDPANLTPARIKTTTALQALALSNNEFILQQARHFAARLEREAGADAASQITRAFHLAFARPPTREELAGATQLVRSDSLFALCRMLLNANEFVYVD